MINGLITYTGMWNLKNKEIQMNETNEIKSANNLLFEYDDGYDVEEEEVIEEEGNDEGIVKIFYSDFDLEKRTDILRAIDSANEFIDVFGDELVREAIEDEIKK